MKKTNFPLLLALFSASGCSALIYEIVWYQSLQLVIGSTSVSLGILLATFMGGLCIGSLLLPKLKSDAHPLRIYAALEAGIALCAILVQLAFPYLNRAYLAGAQHGMSGMLLRGILAAICMILPTILMGASLPAVVRGSKSTLKGISGWGLLYGGNTAGAVFGCLFAGFYLLRVYTMSTAIGVAAAINLVVALIAYFAGGQKGTEEERSQSSLSSASQPACDAQPAWLIYFAIALSGATALGAEVVWTRLLGMLLLGTVYVFSIILAVFLTGLALGSAVGSKLLSRLKAQTAFGWCQILLVFAIAWTAWTISSVLPLWKDEVLNTLDPWHMYLLDLKRVVLAVLPPALFWGASFPLACAAAARPGEDSSRATGRIYAANTLGGIIGALLVSLVLIPAIGSQQSERVLLVTTAVAGLAVLFPVLRKKSSAGLTELAAAVIVAAVLARSIGPIPGDLIAYGRFMNKWAGMSTILYSIEGRNSSVAISQWNDGTIFVNVNGHVEATTEPADMKLQRMVGHLPAMLHPNPKSVLGIGFGAGVSAGTFTRYPGIEKITICEIEPVIPPTSTRFFGPQNYRVALDPRTHIVFDDARHFLLTESEKFDVIASDPLDVFIKGTAALYTKEYFESVKRHLNPGGLFSLYVPLYETDETTIRSELATFFEAFPNGTIWANTRDNQGYDMVFLGQADPLKIDLDLVDERFRRTDYDKVRESLQGISVHSTFDLFSSYTGNATDLNPWTKGAPINTDADLRLSYLAGWGINSKLEDYLYRKMVEYTQTPEEVFTGSKENVARFLTVWNLQREQLAYDGSQR